MPRRSSRAKYYNSTAVSDLKNKLDFWNHSYGVSWDQTKSVRITGSDGTILYTPYYRVDYVSKEIFFTKALSAARPKLETVILFSADTAFGRVFRCSREPNAKLRDLRRCRQNDFQFQSSNNTEHTRLLRYMTEPLPPPPEEETPIRRHLLAAVRAARGTRGDVFTITITRHYCV